MLLELLDVMLACAAWPCALAPDLTPDSPLGELLELELGLELHGDTRSSNTSGFLAG